MTPVQVLAFRRPRSVGTPLFAEGDSEISLVQGLRSVVFESLRSRRYAAAAAAIASVGRPTPSSAVAALAGKPVGWALAHGRSWRFPFMAASDLQIGLVFVEPNHRHAGVGFRLVAHLASACDAPTGDLWWLCAQSNSESVGLAARAGFREVGRLRRLDRLRGFRFEPSEPVSSD